MSEAEALLTMSWVMRSSACSVGSCKWDKRIEKSDPVVTVGSSNVGTGPRRKCAPRQRSKRGHVEVKRRGRYRRESDESAGVTPFRVRSRDPECRSVSYAVNGNGIHGRDAMAEGRNSGRPTAAGIALIGMRK